MPTHSYASLPHRPIFNRTPLFLALTSLALVLLYLALQWLLTDLPFLPPQWLRTLAPFLFAPAMVAPFAGIMAITSVAFRYHSHRQLLAVLFLSLSTFATPFLALYFVDRRDPCFPPYVAYETKARGIAQSCLIYADENAGHFPPHLAVLLLDETITPRHLSTYDLMPYQLPSPFPPTSAWPAIAVEVDAHSLFVYTAADLIAPLRPPELPKGDPNLIIAYSKPSRLIPWGRILAFADGHAESIPLSQLPATFAASNTARAKLHLPPFTLDGPPPK